MNNSGVGDVLVSDVAGFSRFVSFAGLQGAGIAIEFDADADQRGAIAQRLDIVSLDEFKGQVSLKPATERDVYFCAGHIYASLAQTCVVTGDPAPERIDADFERFFTPGTEEDEDEIILDVDEELPEPVAGGGIDLLEIALEELAVNLDPYPRGPEADKVMAALEEQQKRDGGHAFDALSSLLAKKD